jgi:hypothetical protein
VSKIKGEDVEFDRVTRGMSRKQYAAMLGPPFSHTKVRNIERGRELTWVEEKILLRHIGDDVGTNDAPRDERPVEDEPAPRARPSTPTRRVRKDEPPPEPEVPPLEDVLPPQPMFDDDDVESDDSAYISVSEPKPPTVEEQAPSLAPAEDDTVIQYPLPTKYEFETSGYHVTNSELRTFKRCPRKWYFAYYRGMKSKIEEVVGPRAIGTNVHLALAAYYSMKADPLETLRRALKEDEKRLSPDDPEKAKQFMNESELARLMVEGYLEWLEETGQDQGLEIIAPEDIVEVEFPAMDDIVLVGKIDLRVERVIDNARLFLDHKTVGSLNAPIKTLHMDEQMLHYHLLEFLELMKAGADQTQHSMGGLYNMLRKVKRTATAKPPFYDRVEVHHNIHELRSYFLRIFGEITRIMEVRAQLDEGMKHQQVAYPNPTGDCSWDCDYFAVCPLFDDGSAAEEMLQAHYEKGRPHAHYFPYGEREHLRVVRSENDDE